jgi:hypothetical protein
MKMMQTVRAAMLFGLLYGAGIAQTVPASTGDGANPSASAPDALPAESPLSRWLTVDSLSFSIRYRNSDSTSGSRNFDSGQEKMLAAGKFKLDKDGKYFIGFRASSGRYFNWSFSTFSGVNFDDTVSKSSPASLFEVITLIREGAKIEVPVARGWNFYVRELYLSATPVKYVTLEFGGLGLEHGAGTEITNFDDDGYMAGERIRVKDKDHLYFDEISGTFGYFGDIDTPNFFARGDRLAENNYRQVMAQKAWGKRLKASLAYDWINGLNTFREATLLNTSESRVADGVRLELYQRTNSIVLDGLMSFPGGNGWSLTANRSLAKKKVQLEGGYADIDRYNGVYTNQAITTVAGFSLNGDSYQIGKRILLRASYTPAPAVSLFGFFTHEVATPTDPLYVTFNHQNWQVGMMLNFKSLLEGTGLLK